MKNKENEIVTHSPLLDNLPLDRDKPWDTISVISKLVEAADILLHKKDYDGHGWEEIEMCYVRGLEILDQHKQRQLIIQDNITKI